MTLDGNPSNTGSRLSVASIDAIREALKDTTRFLETLNEKPCRESAIVWYEEWVRKCQLERDLARIEG